METQDNMTPEEYISSIMHELPSPSEWDGNMDIPFGIYGYNHEHGHPEFGRITLVRDYHDGICIGWKIKD